MLPPRVVVAAPASGSGKTTVTTGLLGALAARGTAVAPAKVGPDYVDPGYHALASGRPGRNLDPVLVGPSRIPGLLAHGAAGADLAVVEGVMGLYDGRIASSSGPSDDDDRGSAGGSLHDDGSTAHVARLLDAPVVLVVDARGQARSVGALLSGFVAFDPRVRVAGAILNRVGTARHEQVLRAACAEVGLPVLGVLPRRAELAVPSRHLGLVTAAEHGAAARAAVDAMASLVAEHVDLGALVALADRAPVRSVLPWDPAAVVREDAAFLNAEVSDDASLTPTVSVATSSARRPVIAMAGGPAFTFGYPEHRELLAAAGAEVVTVDPLRDEALPPGTAGLVLPGGFPEEHVGALSQNAPLRDAVHTLARAGAPVHAECGGLLYLCTSLDGAPMCGVLPASAAMGPTLALGYRTARAPVDSPVAAAGETVVGHEFHRTVASPRAGATPAWEMESGPEGFVHGGVHASYLHTHPAGNPAAVRRFVRATEP